MSEYLFQSTLPRRERRFSTIVNAGYAGFNPRSHEGSDLGELAVLWIIQKFQSTLPRRERRLSHKRLNNCKRFQSTLPRRERPLTDNVFTPEIMFQSTLPRRERLNWAGTSEDAFNVSIHAPTKGATGESALA